MSASPLWGGHGGGGGRPPDPNDRAHIRDVLACEQRLLALIAEWEERIGPLEANHAMLSATAQLVQDISIACAALTAWRKTLEQAAADAEQAAHDKQIAEKAVDDNERRLQAQKDLVLVPRQRRRRLRARAGFVMAGDAAAIASHIDQALSRPNMILLAIALVCISCIIWLYPLSEL